MNYFSLLVAFTFCSLSSFAQELSHQLVLKKGDKIKISSTMNSVNTQAMMGGEPSEMKTDMVSETELVVSDVNENGYTLQQTLTKMTMDFDGFGQKMHYDSESKEKQDNPFAQQLAEKIGKPEEIKVGLNGKLIENTKVEEGKEGAKKGGKGGGRGMMRAMNQNEAAKSAFLVIPKEGIEKGVWEETTEKDGLTTRKRYTMGAIMGSMATVTVQSQTKGEIDMNRGGMAMTSKVNTLTEEMLMVDITTGRVQMHTITMTNNSVTVMNGTESPSTGKTTITTNIE